MAGRQTLDLLIGVRILSPQPFVVPSSRGLGRGPLKAKTRVRIPLGPPKKSMAYPETSGLPFAERGRTATFIEFGTCKPRTDIHYITFCDEM